jgi:hypothetical protein
MATLSKDESAVAPPDDLDGAKVIQWAWSGTEPFGYLPVDNDSRIEIYGLAVCQYEESPHVYRFSCDENWEVQQDAPYNSIEEALSELPDQYKLVAAKWLTK